MSKRFTRPPRLLALGGFVAVIACLLALPAGGAKAAAGASYTGTRGTASRIADASASLPTGVQQNDAIFACTNMTDLPTPENCPAGGDGDDAAAAFSPMFAPSTAQAPKAANAGTAQAGNVVANFNGVSDDDNHAANGFHVTPPDQGLCVGAAGPLKHAGLPLGVGNQKSVVVEPVNDAWSVYSTNGTLLFGPDSLADLFNDPDASGDVSCNYDPATQTYFFTEIGVLQSGPDAGNFATDLAVVSPNGYAPYQVDTSVGATCFPDFPHQGYDDNAFFISINEFCGPDEDDFAGANLYAFSKSQLVGLSPSVNLVTFGPLVLAHIPVLALQPAVGDGTSTEYLLNSVPYDQFGNQANIAASLGYWQLTGGQHITSGSGNVTLTGQSIPSQQYAFPQPAASTGDGSVTNGDITSEPFLNPDDSRLEQVQYASGTLYTSLNTALLVGNNPNPVDGAAWFAVNASKGKVSSQGVVGLAKTYLLYPSILLSGSGNLILDFSMTSPKLNPSTGYAVSKNGGKSFGPVQTTANGSGPHLSFSDIDFDEARWGDYSAITLDPSSGNVWMADEYTVPTAGPPVDNWGTRVWALTP